MNLYDPQSFQFNKFPIYILQNQKSKDVYFTNENKRFLIFHFSFFNHIANGNDLAKSDKG